MKKKLDEKKSALFLWETKESSRHFLVVLSFLSLSFSRDKAHHLWDIAKEESDDDDDERQRDGKRAAV